MNVKFGQLRRGIPVVVFAFPSASEEQLRVVIDPSLHLFHVLKTLREGAYG